MDFLLSSLISYQCCLAPIHPTRPMEKLQVSDDEAEGTANQCKTQGVSGWMEKGIVSGKCITNYDSDSIVSSSLFAFAASYGS